MGGTQDKRQPGPSGQSGPSGKGPDEIGTGPKHPTGKNPTRPQQPEKVSRHPDDEARRRREEDRLREGDVEGDEV
ncbi:hypothetical protein [Streptomyces sp. NPDC059979]|uniref:hypothetical protein n=1 Tax=unclassified Streptomyces TaxID=2593676 RepID=UPI0036626A8D